MDSYKRKYSTDKVDPCGEVLWSRVLQCFSCFFSRVTITARHTLRCHWKAHPSLSLLPWIHSLCCPSASLCTPLPLFIKRGIFTPHIWILYIFFSIFVLNVLFVCTPPTVSLRKDPPLLKKILVYLLPNVSSIWDLMDEALGALCCCVCLCEWLNVLLLVSII